MQLSELLRIVLRRKLVVLTVFTLVVAGAAGLISQRKPVYRSSSTMLFLPDRTNQAAISFYGSTVKDLIPTYAELLKSRSFLDVAAAKLPFPTSGQQLKGVVSGQSVPNSAAFKIVARTQQPARAALVARTTTDTFVDELANNGVVTVRVVDAARTGTPVNSGSRLVIGAALVLATFLAIATALAWERLFGRIQDSRELSAAAGLPALGVIPEERALAEGSRVLTDDEAAVSTQEALRSLRTNLLFAMNRDGLRSVLITSLNAQDGKSTVTANLAVTMAELGFDVLLVDGDIYKPTVHKLFGLPNDRGFTSCILDGLSPDGLPQHTRWSGLRVVTAGRPLSARSQEIDLYLGHLHRFSELADLVVIDSPPLEASADVRLLAVGARSALLLVRAGSVGRNQVVSAVESLRSLEIPVLGVALNRSRDEGRAGRSYNYYAHRPQRRDEGAPSAAEQSAGEGPAGEVPAGLRRSGAGPVR